jgi:hypothetical protein
VPFVKSRAEAAVLIGVLGLAVGLRVSGLTAGLWFDEIRTLVGYSRAPFAEIVPIYDSQNQHLLYTLLSHGAFMIFGESNWALRLPAVVFGVASIACLYWFAVTVTSRREAMLATALLAVSYHHVWFSQNARGYTVLLVATLAASNLFLRLLAREPRQRDALAYAVVMALAVATHVTAALVVATHFLIWCVMWRKRRTLTTASWLPFGAFALAGTLALQCYALILPQFIRVLTTPSPSGTAAEWKNPLWFLAEMVRGLSSGLPGGAFALAVGCAVMLAGTVSYLRQRPLLGAVMLLPGAITGAVMFLLEHNLWPRFFFFCAGFAVLIAVRGVFVTASLAPGRRGPQLATAVLVLLAIGSAGTVPRAWQPKQDYAAARDYIERMRGPNDAVIAVDLARYPYEQYLQTNWSTAANLSELESIEASHARTWVLYTFPARLSTLQPDIWRRLQHSYTTAAEFPGTVGGGAIIVKVRS